MKRKGLIFVLSAPSGCGKTTLSKMLLKSGLKIIRSISMTTRPPRSGEKDGRDYFFVNEKEFKKIKSQGGFLEWAVNFDFFYGTPKKFVLDSVKKGKDILLSIDVKGAMNVKKLFKEAILIFIVPPSLEDLKKRLTLRKTDGPEDIKKRLCLAKKEISYLNKYDYRIINDNLTKAFVELKSIVMAERCRICRR